ncbi:hypothetical protein [Streptomyces sp. NPDC002467]|uniref:hypothetical protein n=1 Tax=Streptomyces sp. NPDC002467 TaxID=3364647 RepID=UPI00369976AB
MRTPVLMHVRLSRPGALAKLVDRMRAELRELATAVVDHPHWATVPREDPVNARMQLKKQTRLAEPDDVTEAA